MNRVVETFRRLRSSGTKALIPYITPEFPSAGITVPLLRTLEEAGADMIELGIPFSDPLADGRTIQRSSERALRNGVTPVRVLEFVREFRSRSTIPVILMGYVNPLLQFGIDPFFRECREAGADALIVPDLPPEEALDVKEIADRNGIGITFLIAPTSSDERIRVIDRLSTDFTYCVSLTGVTGARAELGLNGSLDGFLHRVKKNTQKPFVVGFGISGASQVERIWKYADGAVVGSALLDQLEKGGNRDEMLRNARNFLKSLRPS